MVELGELEKHHDDFAKRHVRVIAVSNDDQQTAQATQADFPDLLIVSDADQNLAKAVEVIHKNTNAPTTFLVDGKGTVRWFFRPERFIVRIAPNDLLEAADKNLVGK